MQMRLRKAMTEPSPQLDGIIELDETYVGGDLVNKSKQRRKSKYKKKVTGMEHKSTILGMLQISGKVIVRAIEKANKETIQPILKQSIASSSSVISDGFGGYAKLNSIFRRHIVLPKTKRKKSKRPKMAHTNTFIISAWTFNPEEAIPKIPFRISGPCVTSDTSKWSNSDKEYWLRARLPNTCKGVLPKDHPQYTEESFWCADRLPTVGATTFSEELIWFPSKDESSDPYIIQQKLNDQWAEIGRVQADG